MPYAEAMARFGSDKPDTRFGLELQDVSEIVKNCEFKVFSGAIAGGGSVRGINIQSGAEKFSRKEIDAFGEYVKTYRAKGLAWLCVGETEHRSSFAKFLKPEEVQAIISAMDGSVGDLLVFVADQNQVVFDALGALRLEVAKKLDLIDKTKYDLLWITEFPLLEYSEEEGRYTAMHHPFTAPMDEDIALLDTSIRGKSAQKPMILLSTAMKPAAEASGFIIQIYSKKCLRR